MIKNLDFDCKKTRFLHKKIFFWCKNQQHMSKSTFRPRDRKMSFLQYNPNSNQHLNSGVFEDPKASEVNGDKDTPLSSPPKALDAKGGKGDSVYRSVGAYAYVCRFFIFAFF